MRRFLKNLSRIIAAVCFIAIIGSVGYAAVLGLNAIANSAGSGVAIGVGVVVLLLFFALALTAAEDE